jgi:hypothetical protein
LVSSSIKVMVQFGFKSDLGWVEVMFQVKLTACNWITNTPRIAYAGVNNRFSRMDAALTFSIEQTIASTLEGHELVGWSADVEKS